MTSPPVWVDTLDGCAEACGALRSSGAVVALDLEGTDLARNGELSLLQIGTHEGPVYLIDVLTLGSAAFKAGLGDLLEDPEIQKIIFDLRCDADILFHRFGVKPCNFIDLQVMYVYCMASKRKAFKHLPGVMKVLSEVQHISASLLAEFQDIKKNGRAAMEEAEKEGVPSCFSTRPLPEFLKCYAAKDVEALFMIWDEWREQSDLEHVREVSQVRMLRYLKQPLQEKGSERDFLLQSDLRTVFAAGISNRLSTEDVKREFETYGEVLEVHQKEGERFAFIEFAAVEGATNAIRDCKTFKGVSYPTKVQPLINNYLKPQRLQWPERPVQAIESPRHSGASDGLQGPLPQAGNKEEPTQAEPLAELMLQ